MSTLIERLDRTKEEAATLPDYLKNENDGWDWRMEKEWTKYLRECRKTFEKDWNEKGSITIQMPPVRSS